MEEISAGARKLYEHIAPALIEGKPIATVDIAQDTAIPVQTLAEALINTCEVLGRPHPPIKQLNREQLAGMLVATIQSGASLPSELLSRGVATVDNSAPHQDPIDNSSVHFETYYQRSTAAGVERQAAKMVGWKSWTRFSEESHIGPAHPENLFNQLLDTFVEAQISQGRSPTEARDLASRQYLSIRLAYPEDAFGEPDTSRQPLSRHIDLSPKAQEDIKALLEEKKSWKSWKQFCLDHSITPSSHDAILDRLQDTYLTQQTSQGRTPEEASRHASYHYLNIIYAYPHDTNGKPDTTKPRKRHAINLSPQAQADAETWLQEKKHWKLWSQFCQEHELRQSNATTLLNRLLAEHISHQTAAGCSQETARQRTALYYMDIHPQNKGQSLTSNRAIMISPQAQEDATAAIEQHHRKSGLREKLLYAMRQRGGWLNRRSEPEASEEIIQKLRTNYINDKIGSGLSPERAESYAQHGYIAITPIYHYKGEGWDREPDHTKPPKSLHYQFTASARDDIRREMERERQHKNQALSFKDICDRWHTSVKSPKADIIQEVLEKLRDKKIQQWAKKHPTQDAKKEIADTYIDLSIPKEFGDRLKCHVQPAALPDIDKALADRAAFKGIQPKATTTRKRSSATNTGTPG